LLLSRVPGANDDESRSPSAFGQHRKRLHMTHPRFFSSEDTPMRALYAGLPAAASVEQSIIFAQLELLRRLDPARVQTAKAVLLGQ
jgi:hypothetical protein